MLIKGIQLVMLWATKECLFNFHLNLQFGLYECLNSKLEIKVQYTEMDMGFTCYVFTETTQQTNTLMHAQ